MKRYEILQRNSISITYDRLNRCVLTLEQSRQVTMNEKMPFRFSLYPNKLLRRICVSTNVICTLYAMTTFSFLGAFVLMVRCVTFVEISKLIGIAFSLPLIMALSILTHESAHAIIAAACGGLVAEIGFWKGSSPYKTVVFGKWQSKKEVFLFYYAGVASNMFLAIIGTVVFFFSGLHIFFLIAVSNYFFVILNVLPFSNNTDGGRLITILRK